MTTWFTSDLHLGHANIIRYCGRPFADVAEMDASLAAVWRATVAGDDHVWVLGDVALGDVRQGLGVLAELPGVKHLVVGNHDRVFRRMGEARPQWEERYREAGFVDIVHGAEVLPAPQLGVDADGDVRLCHFPYSGDSRASERYPEHRPRDDGTPLLHGHTHGRWRCHVSEQGTPQVDVGVDAWGGRIVAGTEIATLLADAADVAPLPWAGGVIAATATS